jgi:ketosteroid isomerase-like protein
MSAIYEEDAVPLPPGSMSVRGRADIAKFVCQAYQQHAK